MFKTVFLIILFFIYTHIFIIYIFYKEENNIIIYNPHSILGLAMWKILSSNDVEVIA